MLAHSTIDAAAGAADVPVKTVYGWISKDPAFTTMLNEAESEAMAATARIAANISTAAIRKLETLMNNSDDERIQLRAAAEILKTTPQFRVLAAIERRLAQLERTDL